MACEQNNKRKIYVLPLIRSIKVRVNWKTNHTTHLKQTRLNMSLEKQLR
jgi:hypothetical protein